MADPGSPTLRNLYVKAVPPPDLNKNTSWFQYPGVWTSYLLLIFFIWLFVLSVFGCSAGSAWSIVHLLHFAITYWSFHWKKGTPFAEDQDYSNPWLFPNTIAVFVLVIAKFPNMHKVRIFGINADYPT